MHRINDALRQYVADRDLVAFPTHKHGMVPGHPWPLPNVQLGFSAEDQPNWDQRSSLLPHFEAAVRWVSIEPQLDHIELGAGIKDLDWGVVGAESGPGARPYEVEWAMSAVRQFQQAKTPIFVKQLGPHPTYRGNPIALSDAKGCKMEEWTGALKTLARREFPT